MPAPRTAPLALAALATLATLALLVVSGWNPYDRATWLMEVAPVLVVLPLLCLTYERFPLTPLLYACIFVHAVVLMVGGAYTYARVPIGFAVQDALDLSRNPYDKLGHLFQGFVPALAAREILRRGGYVNGRRMLAFLVVCVVLAISAVYELVEWGAALALGQGADEFLGTQGDPWDTQSDMFTALIGAVVALSCLARLHDRQLAAKEPSAGRRNRQDVEARMREIVHAELAAIDPLDALEREHLAGALAWVESGAELCRVARPATPPIHLVSYFAVVDAEHLLLVDHRNAQLWLPTGGHVEPGEHPRQTVLRELAEELGIAPALPVAAPLMVTRTTTVGRTAGHTDVSLWYVVHASREQPLVFDREEFAAVRWFGFDEIPFERSDPHMRRFIAKLRSAGERDIGSRP